MSSYYLKEMSCTKSMEQSPSWEANNPSASHVARMREKRNDTKFLSEVLKVSDSSEELDVSERVIL